MALEEFDCEAGSNGTTVTNSNTGNFFSMSGQAGPGTTAKYATAAAANGLLGIDFARQSGTTAVFGQHAWATPASRGVTRHEFSFPVVPTGQGDTGILEIRNGANSLVGFVVVDTTGHLAIRDSTGAPMASPSSQFADPLANGVEYRLETAWGPATSTTGACSVKYFEGANSTTAKETISLTGRNFGTTATCGWARFGLRTGSFIGSYYVDDPAVDSLSTGFIGPVGSIAPTANATGSPSYIINATTSTAGGGGALTYSITQLSGPTGAATLLAPGVWSVPRPTGSVNSVYRVTVNEAGNGNDTVDVTVTPSTGAGGELQYDGTTWS